MTANLHSPDTFDVLIVGGGVAGLETTLALRELAGDRVAVTVIAPDPEFVYRPMTVGEPFAHASARRHDLHALVTDMGAELVVDQLARVDAAQLTAHTEAGRDMPYDALVLALGARPYERYPYALTIDDRHLGDLLHGLIQDVEGGYVHSVAFVIPPRMAWPLPTYELALMTAERAYDTSAELAITIVTPEDTPLAIFGQGASTGIAELLAEAGIAVIASAYAEIPESGHVVIAPGDRGLEVDRVVALPELMGPAVEGLPGDAHGFIPVDLYGRVRDVERVYAAGDGTDFAIKHGGIAAQQADTVALTIAGLVGAPVEPKPFHPEIHGVLMTGRKPRYLSAHVTGGDGFSSEITETPTWSPPSKIAARYLAPYLDQATA